MRQIFTKNKNVPDGRISAVRCVLAFLLLLALCCVSCRNVIEAPEEPAEIAESGGGEGATGKLYTLSGAVGAGGAVPSSLATNSRSAAFGDTGGGIENGVYGDAGTADGTAIQSGRAAAANARSATYSSGQLTGVSYTVTATTVSSSDSDKNPPDTKKTVDATVADDGSHRFYIELLEGTYTLSVEGFLGEGDGKKKILEGAYRNADTDDTVVIGPASSPDNCNILVHPIFDGDGTGTVRLTLSMEADCNIKCLKAVWEVQADDGTKTPKTQTFKNNDGSNLTSVLFTMTADGETASGIPAGFHRVDFYFYGDEGGTDELYSCTQYLNVFENLTTDLWRNNGATPYIDDDGKFTLTRSVIYSRKLFYVKNRNDSEKGEGTRYSPFDSVQTAVQKILAANDGASEYKIALLSDDTDKSTSSYTADTSRSYICIKPDKPLKLIIESDISESRDTNEGKPFTINAARDAGKTGRVMYIGKNAEVTLNNIKITGGNTDSGYSGGGIENASENLKLSRVTIFDCTATRGHGGGIRSTGTLTMTDCTLTNCTADNGGGVGNNGTLSIIGGTISDCSVSPDSSSGSNGGGVYNAGTLTMGGVSITNCTTAVGGGGIYNFGNSATATITGCTITGCKSTSQTYGGGGIYINSGTLELINCTITGGGDIANPDATNGGGIYNNTGGTLRMTGGSVINCTASATDSKKGGGGIFSSGTLVISGVTVSGCSAGACGGGILVAGTSAENAVADCIIKDCTVQTAVWCYGGGIYVAGKLTVSGGTISGCTAKSQGGGFLVSSGSAEIKGCSISNCKANNGGGINNHGTLTVSEGTSVSDCTGMGVVFNWGTLSVTDGTTISGGTNACGIYNNGGRLTVDDCTIFGCTYGSCGGIYIYKDSASANISNCTISDCHASTTASNTGRGGGINNECKSTEITGCTITGCTATYDGGGIYNNVSDASAVTKIENCEISGCKALGTAYNNGYGGGICNAAGTLEVTDVNITGGGDETAQDARTGGGILNKGTLTVTGGEITDCVAVCGGGIYTGGAGAAFSADGTTISSCTAIPTSGSGTVLGGGIYSGTVTASCTLADCIIQSCTAKSNSTSGGGGIYHRYGELIITGGEISRCTSNGGGGGIDMQQDSTSTKKTVITGTKFSECRSRFHGGGLSIHNAIATVELTDCTVESCEVTDTNYGGGGISVLNGFVSRWTYVTVENCSVKSCTASFGSGIFNSDSNGDTLLTLKDSEVSGDVSARYKGSHLSLSGSTTVTDGAIDLSVYTSPTNSSVQIAGALSKSSVAKIKLGTAYAAGDTILTAADASVYTLTAEDCNRFTIDGAYGIAYSGGNGVLKKVPDGFSLVRGGTVTGSSHPGVSGDTKYTGVFVEGRTVRLSPYLVCDHEVTQGEWRTVMAGNAVGVSYSPSCCTAANSTAYGVNFGSDYDNRPVENISWYDAVYYCNVRSEKEGLTPAYNISGITESGGHITAATVSLVSDVDGYRLPTEAEWEFAARGGDPDGEQWNWFFSGAERAMTAATGAEIAYTSAFNSKMDSVGWYSRNNWTGTTNEAEGVGSDPARKGTHEVKQLGANALGLYDMSGNVFEWCWDWAAASVSISGVVETDPTGPDSGSMHIIRGGAWASGAYRCSPVYRDIDALSCAGESTSDMNGLRVVRSFN